MRFIRSGKYADEFSSLNKKIDQCLDSLSFNVSVRNEERRQEDMNELKAFIKVSCNQIFYGIKQNIREEGLALKLLDEVKEMASNNRSMMHQFLEKLGHDSSLIEAEKKSLDIACEKLVQDSLLCHNEVLEDLRKMDSKLDRLIGRDHREVKLQELKEKMI